MAMRADAELWYTTEDCSVRGKRVPTLVEMPVHGLRKMAAIDVWDATSMNFVAGRRLVSPASGRLLGNLVQYQ